MNTQDKYLAALRAGMSKGAAARAAGVTTSTTHRWAKKSAIHRLKVRMAIAQAKADAAVRFHEFMEAAR